MNDEVLSALGLCRKAGKLIFGFDTVKFRMQKNEAVLVLSACDLSSKTAKELIFLTENTQTELIQTNYDMKTLGQSIGKMTGIIAITDEGLAQMVKTKLRRGI